jgi:hypothetical protein
MMHRFAVPTPVLDGLPDPAILKVAATSFIMLFIIFCQKQKLIDISN